jgi:hypothetical protein
LKSGDLVRLKKAFLDPHWTCTALVIKWTKKHQFKVTLLWDNGEIDWEYVKDLEIISESR